MALSEAAREKRNEYQRAWRKKNRDKVKKYDERKWERKVLKEQESMQHDNMVNS